MYARTSYGSARISGYPSKSPVEEVGEGGSDFHLSGVGELEGRPRLSGMRYHRQSTSPRQRW